MSVSFGKLENEAGFEYVWHPKPGLLVSLIEIVVERGLMLVERPTRNYVKNEMDGEGIVRANNLRGPSQPRSFERRAKL